MEKQSVFEHLAKRFSECRKEIESDKVMSDGDIPNVMFTAGKALFAKVSSKEIQLGDIPPWFTVEPKGTSPHHGNICHSWDLYWLTAIEWLVKNKPDSGITFPGYILHRVSLKERLYSGLDINDILHYWHGLRDEHLKRVWRQLARASEDACSYLASKDVRAEKPAEIQQSQRTEIPSEIKLMKQIADKLKDMDENKDQDRQLFSQIAIDVREHLDKYRNAGEWLDKYWEEKRQVSQLVRFNEARQDLLKKYEKQDFIPEDDAIRILLITWLLTDADAQKTNPNITQFAGWPWKPTDDITSGSRCAASSLWCKNAYGYDCWMRLVRIAWKTVDTQKPAEKEQAKRRSIIGWIVEVIIAMVLLAVCLYVFGVVTGIFIFAALLTSFHLLGWLELIRAFIYKIVGPK